MVCNEILELFDIDFSVQQMVECIEVGLGIEVISVLEGVEEILCVFVCVVLSFLWVQGELMSGF